MSFLKKLTILFLLCFSFTLFAEKLELKNPVPVKNIPNFVETKLPAMISLKSPLFKGTIQNSHTIYDVAIHRVSWTYNDIPVVGRFTVVKEKDGKVVNIVNGLQDFSIDTNPALSAEQAALISAKELFGRTISNPDFVSKLVIIAHNGEYKLAYRIRFRPQYPLDGRYFFVDAGTGKILRSGDLIKYATNRAKVFEMNPISTPDPVEVTLPWVADDADGKLSAAADANGLRKVVAANCPNEGSTYYDRYPRCTFRQLADKNKNGSFIYEDWEDGVSYSFDVTDIYPEVSMYYHITKIYKYLAGLGLNEYTELPNHRGTNPIVGIANYQQMVADSSGNYTLQPYGNAFYLRYDSSYKDWYSTYLDNFNYLGSDALIFGQSKKIDYAYDGDVVYHEFGHGVVHGIAQFEFDGWTDKYGFSNEITGMDEGMSDVFSFIMSKDPCLAEYAAKGTGVMGGAINIDGTLCLRTATNTNNVNEDFIGESHHDGLPLLGSHWKIYKKMLEKGFSTDDFAKIFLTALMSVPSSETGYREWGELILDATASSPASALKNDFEKILTDRGFFEEIRARNVKNSADYLYFGGVSDGNSSYSKNTVYIKNESGKTQEVSPGYVQLYYDVPECVNTLTISGTPTAEKSGTPEFSVFVRKGEPVIWNHNSSTAVVKYDKIITSSDNKKWVFENLEPGARYYFQFINTGTPGFFYNPKVKTSWSSEEECTVEPDDDADPVSDEDVSDSTGDSDHTDTTDTTDPDADSDHTDTGSDHADTDTTDTDADGDHNGSDTNDTAESGDLTDSGDSTGNETCGNGIVEENEQCDDGNTISGDGCSKYCMFENEPKKKSSGGCSVSLIN